MRVVSFNIQFGRGRDGRIDLERVAALVSGADVICLQEVDRHWRRSGMADQVASLAALLSDRHWVYGPGIDVDASMVDGGKVINRRRQFGNLTLSRWPIVSTRRFVLPKHDTGRAFNAFCPALETVIAAPSGPLRLINLHLSHAKAEERLDQIAALERPVLKAREEGGAWQGTDVDFVLWQCGDPEPPHPADCVVLGDFNAEPHSAELARLTGTPGFGLADAWALAHTPGDAGTTFFRDPHQGVDHDLRIDYVLITPGLLTRLKSCRVDDATRISDHQPVWAEFQN